jgi:YD repeat-containing protein
MKQVEMAAPKTKQQNIGTVKTPDGTSYRLGYETQSEQVLYPTMNGIQDEHGNYEAPYSGNQQKYTTYRWRLDLVEDMHSNQMRYWYYTCRTADNEPVPPCGLYDSGPSQQRDVSSYLHRIEYNNYNGSWLGEVELNSIVLPGTPVPQLDGPIFATVRWLDDIRVKWEGTVVAEYDMEYEDRSLPNSGRVALLKAIDPYGLDGKGAASPLPGPRFEYGLFDNKGRCHSHWGSDDPIENPEGEPCKTNSPNHQWLREAFAYERLVAVASAYGDRTEFSYVNDGRGAYWGPYFNYRVTQRRIYEDGNLERRYSYNYGTPCYDQYDAQAMPSGSELCPGPSPESFGPLLGYDQVTITLANAAGTNLSVNQHEFHTTGVHYVDYILRGRETESRQYGPDGTTLWQKQIHTHAVNHPTHCPPSGIPGSPLVTCLIRTDTTQYDPNLNTSLTTRQDNYYDPAFQFDPALGVDGAGVQFGRQTHKHLFHLLPDQNGGEEFVRQRTNITAYRANSQNWVVVPTYQGDYGPGPDWELLGATFLQYDENTSPINQSIGSGRLMVQRQLAALPSAGCGSSQSQLMDTVDVSYNYHADYPGLVTTTTNYEGYGEVACSDFAWHTISSPGKGSGEIDHTVTYDAQGLRPVSSQNHLEHEQTTTYDAALPWLPANVTDPNGAITRYGYDRFGRLTAVARPGDDLNDATVVYTYWDDPDIPGTGGTVFLSPLLIETSYKDTLQENVRQFYNGLGQLVQTQHRRSQLNGTTERDVLLTYAYDARGRQVCQTVPYDIPPYYANSNSPYQEDNCLAIDHTATSYDAAGRVSQVTAPDGSVTSHHYGIIDGHSYHDSVNPERQRLQYRYDLFGQLAHVYEMTGNCGFWDYTCAGDYTEQWQIYARTDYAYDLVGNLEFVRAHAGDGATLLRQTAMSYDALGRKLTMNDPDMGFWEYEYDPAGNLVNQTDANEQTITFVYDALGRLKTKSHNGTTLADYTYDDSAVAYSSGRLTHMSDEAGWQSWTYDQRGRVTSETRAIDGVVDDWIMNYSYDNLDRPVSMTYPDGEVVTTFYNKQGAPRRLLGTNLYVSAATYNVNGQMVQLNLGHGRTTSYGYDPDTFRLTGLETDNGLQNLSYEYDNVGNITTINDHQTYDQQIFSYDSLNRLQTAAAQPMGGPFCTVEPCYNHSYEYNELGNIKNYAGNSYQYDEVEWHVDCYDTPEDEPEQPLPHAVRHIDSHYFCYDHNGNMISRNHSTVNYTQEFDVENRLVRVIDNDSGEETHFGYDANGQRLYTEKPDGTITYYPFPGYEEEVRPEEWQPVEMPAASYASSDPPGWSLASSDTAGWGLSLNQAITWGAEQLPAAVEEWAAGVDAAFPATSVYTGNGVGMAHSGGTPAAAVNNLAQGYAQSQGIQLIPGREYRLRFWIKGNITGSTQVQLLPYGDTKQPITVWPLAAQYSYANQEWQEKEATFIMPAALGVVPLPASYLQVAVDQMNGWIAFDNLRLYELNDGKAAYGLEVDSGEETLIYSSGFENAGEWSNHPHAAFPATAIWRGGSGPATPQEGGYSLVLSNLGHGSSLTSPPVAPPPGGLLTVQMEVQKDLTAPLNSAEGGVALVVHYHENSPMSLTRRQIWHSDQINNSAAWQTISATDTVPINATAFTLSFPGQLL